MVAKIDSSLQYEVKKCLGISTHVLKNNAPKDLDSLPNRLAHNTINYYNWFTP